MHVGAVCTRDVVVAFPDDSLVEAARRMRHCHVGALVVIEEDDYAKVPVGMLTDRDIVVSVVAKDPEDLTRLQVGDVMTTDILTAEEDEAVDHVIARMRTAGVRRIPVVDGDESLVGILALDDLLDIVAEQLDNLARLVTRERKVEIRNRA